MLTIRAATDGDRAAIGAIIGPVIRADETYALARDMSADDALAYWLGPDRETFVAEEAGVIVGTYYLRANQAGGVDHVCNCGYMTAAAATDRGVARRMCADSQERARAAGYRAMQFNFVVATNERAVRLWQDMGFVVLARLRDAFRHPRHGLVDALVMHRML
jgi:ribosomal protein S18 acetylase RimI-like enzyme